jgi:nitrogen regulatory protein PII
MKKRRMFFFERLMYVDGHTPVNCIMTARISGDIAVDDLQLALKKVQGKHPLLRANVVEEDGELYLSFMENPPNIPVRIVERNSGEQWRNVTVAEWKTPFNMQEGPLIRMVWIKSEGVSELMLIGHHCVCDGTSLLTIFREILQIVDRPDTQLTPYPPFESVQELFPQHVLSDWKMVLLVTVKAALFRAGITGITLSRVSGHGGEHEIVSQYRGTTLVMEFHEKVKIEMVCSEPFVQPCIDAILSSARTGEVGDGKIFVQPIERVIRIRTGEQNNDALTAVNANEVQQAALRATDAQ